MAMSETTNGSSRYYPAPFPENLPTIQLEAISIQDLYKCSDETTLKLFRILSNEGFFHLDLSTDPRGQEFLNLSNQLHDAAIDVFNNVSIADKETWRGDPLKGVLDTGYRGMGKDESGQPRVSEVLNVPTYELLHDPHFQLPPWLQQYRDAYTAFAAHGQQIGKAILTSLEYSLHLDAGVLTKMHELSGGTGGFVRMIRLPAPLQQNEKGAAAPPPNPAHTDGNSITILCNWQGGLQIARPTGTAAGRAVKMIDDPARAHDEWLWVKPRPGHAIINLGDPMVVLSNGVLASGRHRVVTPPGEQAAHHRYSVLVGLRTQSQTPMRALRSDVIPPETEEQKAQETVTSLEYAVNKVRAIMERMDQSKA